MKITGKYFVDDNFTTIFTDNEIYVIANNNCDWRRIRIGEYTTGLLTQELFNYLKGQATLTGTFEI